MAPLEFPTLFVKINSSGSTFASPPVSPVAAAPVRFQPVVFIFGAPVNSAKTKVCASDLKTKKKQNKVINSLNFIRMYLASNLRILVEQRKKGRFIE
jgi:hypothetical protein